MALVGACTSYRPCEWWRVPRPCLHAPLTWLSCSFQEDFDVDHFVSDCRKRVQLEELRDDLELYYKLLKTAMVELINKDYADFVNLLTPLLMP